MGKQDFPRCTGGSKRGAKSMMERASEVFHFEDAIKGTGLMPLDIPAELIPPAPKPRAKAGTKTAAGAKRGAVATATTAATDGTARAGDWNGPIQQLDREAMAEAGYLVPGGPINGVGEEFRIIKRELLARIRGNRQQAPIPNGNVILVTSAHPNDGKTYCAVNLAVSLAAESDIEVLLVDADFAKPNIARALGLKPGKGLMDVLADPSFAVEDLVIRTDVPSLCVLPAGESSHLDAEYLASSRTDALIASLVEGRPERLVIFDSPPLLAASPAAVLAAHVGQTVLVVRADRTTETALRDAAGLLNGCPNIQLLLNGVKFSASGRRFGTYYGKEG